MSTNNNVKYDVAIHNLVKQFVVDWAPCVNVVQSTGVTIDISPVINAINEALGSRARSGYPSLPTKYKFALMVKDEELLNVLCETTERLCDAFDIILSAKFPGLKFKEPRIIDADYRTGLGQTISIEWTRKPDV